MLTNAGTWTEISEDSVTKLNNLQNELFRYLLSTPRTTASAALCWDFGALPIKFKIMKEKLTLLYHIINNNEDSLANEIYETQKKFKFPGLIQECLQIIQELGLPNITLDKESMKISKIKWKQLVNKALKEKCSKELKKEILKYKK